MTAAHQFEKRRTRFTLTCISLEFAGQVICNIPGRKLTVRMMEKLRKAACLVIGGLEQAVEGLSLGPLKMAAEHVRSVLYVLDLGVHHMGTPLDQHAGTTWICFTCRRTPYHLRCRQ